MRRGTRARLLGLGASLVAGLASTGCAATLERSNRLVYAVNDSLDRGLVRPVSEVYVGLVPEPLRQGVSNAIDNVGYLDTVLNDFLQGEPGRGGRDLLRFLVNSTAGVGGLLDVGSRLGLERHEEDFGQTLGVWGVPQGPYLVLPLLGPSSLRDVWAVPVTLATNPVTFVPLDEGQAAYRAVELVDGRARHRDELRRRDESAMDPYLFTREAWLQHREFLVRDGEPDQEGSADELDALLDELEEP